MEIGLILLEDVYLIEPKFFSELIGQSDMNANKLLITVLMADSTKKKKFDKITAKSHEREPGGRKPCCAEASNNAPSLAYRHMLGRISYLRSVASGMRSHELEKERDYINALKQSILLVLVKRLLYVAGLYKCQLYIRVKQATVATNSSEQWVQDWLQIKEKHFNFHIMHSAALRGWCAYFQRKK
uniref:Uncharacterized protein n=1 Tax=Glossina austeni TaxID=7395 RepID=A0A1A9VRI2_GLOAU